MAEYCRREGLTASAFGYWKRRLSDEDGAEGRKPASPPRDLLPIARVRRQLSPEVGWTGGSAAVRLVVGDVTVEVASGFDAAVLSRVLEVLMRWRAV